jgi:hypothetical protein
MSLRDFTVFIADFSDYATAATGIFVYLFTYGKPKYYWLSAFLLITGALRITSLILADYDIYNMPVYHLMGCVELICVYAIYRRKGIDRFWDLSMLGIVITYILNSLFIQSLFEVNNLALALSQLFILILGFHFLAGIYQQSEVPFIGKYPFFYINAGFLVYAAGTFFVYLLSSKILGHRATSFFHNTWILEAVFNLFKLSLICTGVIYTKRER